MLVFAAVYRWASIPLAIGCALLGGWALVTRPVDAEARAPRALTAAFAALCLAVTLQLVPLPLEVLRQVTPATDAFLREYRIGYTLTDRHPISLEPGDTALALSLLVSFGLLLFGAVRRLTTRAAESIALGIALLGALVALEGVVQRAVSTETIYGFWRPRTPGAQTFGPFVNRNHFAGWMLMALPLTLGYLFAVVERRQVATLRGWRQRVVWLGSPAASHVVLVGFAVVVMAIALVWTLSRSGMGCFLVALLGWVWAAGRRSGTTMPARTVAVGYLLAIGVVSATWIGTSTIAARFEGLASGSPDATRILAWQDAIRVARAFPLTGTGINTYNTAILLYDSRTTGKYFAQAHNDYLQVAAEGGLLVGIPAIAVVSTFAVAVRRRFTGAGEGYWLRLGAVTGIIAVSLQELVDFSLQIPGNAVLFTTLAAIALHAATTTHPSRSRAVLEARVP